MLYGIHKEEKGFLISYGLIFSIIGGISEFVFNYKINFFGVSIGMVICGLGYLLIEKIERRRKR